MTTRITVRLPDDLVAYMDTLVADGLHPSRAAIVARALERERRHQTPMEDARIYAASPEDEDLAAFTGHASATHPPLD